MSISPNAPQDKLPFSHLPVSPIRPVPALKKDPQEDAESEKPSETPRFSLLAKVLDAEKEAPANAPQAEENEPRKESDEATAPEPVKKPKLRWQEVLLDTLLVSMVVAVLAGGGYYLKSQRDLYRVPSLVERTNDQCIELFRKREALQDAANHADEQLHMRRKLNALETKLRQFSDEAARRTAAINEQQNRVLALQHEIRRADRDARNVARGLLPGLYVGNVTTTRGKVYTETTISRIDGKRIALRTPYGAASLPIDELVKDNMPDIVLYALGLIDLVDMRDFTSDGATPASFKPASNRLRPQSTAPRRTAPADYEPAPTGPVVDTSGQLF